MEENNKRFDYEQIKQKIKEQIRSGKPLFGPVAIGRKNDLFAGSHEAAQRSAMIYSLFATCTLQGINPCHWMKDVLGRMHDYTMNNLNELLPQNWQPKNQ